MSVDTQARSDLVPVGEIAPDFEAHTHEGGRARLSELRGGKRAVLVFYPGDDTPTCTQQLCALRDVWGELEALDTVVVGVNPSGPDRHGRFARKHRFPFPLVADRGGRVAGLYGCRAFFGLFTRRTVYVIDRAGRVAWARRGNPTPEAILQVVKALQDEEARAALESPNS